jgi:hypothetical protein
MARPRRLVIQAPNGAIITDGDQLVAIDLTGLPNADARAPLRAVMQQQCDLAHWHDMNNGTELPLWSDTVA